MGLPVSITICTASALNCGLNLRRCSAMDRSSQSRGPVQDPWYTPVALEAADGFASGLAVPQAAFDVGAGGGVPAQAGEGDAVQGGVGLPIAAAVEPAPLRLAGGGFDRADSAEGGEGGFGVEPVGVVTSGDEQGGAGVGSHAVAGQQVRGVSGQDGVSRSS